jgi:hypothetical protein
MAQNHMPISGSRRLHRQRVSRLAAAPRPQRTAGNLWPAGDVHGMKGKASIGPSWGKVGIGLALVLVVLASLALAGIVLGKAKLTVVKDPRGDGGSLGSGTNQSPGYCDVLRATSKLAKHGRVRHTVTVAGPVGATFNAPPVFITKHRIKGSIGQVPLILVPGQPGVRTHFSNQRRKVTYYLKRRTVKDAVRRSDKYFWVADQTNCGVHDDMAPNHGSASQGLRGRHHRRS